MVTLREIKTDAELLKCISNRDDLSYCSINNKLFFNASSQVRVLEHINIPFSKILDSNFLEAQLKDINFKGSELINCNFEEANLKDIDFEGSKLVNCNFKSAKLKGCNFKNAKLTDCRFDTKEEDKKRNIKYENTKVIDCSFENAKVSNCRFRDAEISKSNFKYAQINTATFEDARSKCCDFYRASFLGVVVFRDCEIENCSLHYTLFSDGAIIRRDNIKNNTILQQNDERYKDFLEDARDKAVNKVGWDVAKSMSERFRDAEDIYRALSALWLSKGYLSDSNWAYVQARKMECEKLKLELKEIPKNERKSSKILRYWIKIKGNQLVGLLFGYGESLKKVLATYIFIFIVFAFLYIMSIPDATFNEALTLSFYSMFPSSSELSLDSFTNMLNTAQTTMSIILAGILGFVLANKIRCQ